MIILIGSRFWWDYYNVDWASGYRVGEYLPLETIDDLVNQFNYVGFNDLCIYPPDTDMAFYEDATSKKYAKGIEAVYYGHTTANQTGK